MTRQFLNSQSDCQWLRDTILRFALSVPKFHSFVIVGNEDWPTRIILYRDSNPRFDATPLATYDSAAIDALLSNGGK